ncbi:hypothetical protein MG293_005802 [Ovis ammon polii]|uniref:Ferritin n=1 Tax=Ovis ammon polii TaxID=230172 RepID=A0AAD4UHU3_OVIAM|nr:hypothetical protein MG293_005802 [Ovis ammon polii]
MSPAMLPAQPSQVHQNYRPECEAALNSLATLEFHASFQCLAVAFYLDHDDVGLKHFSRFFLLCFHEQSKTAKSLMFLQIQHGGHICFIDIRKPETQQWESSLQAIQDTLHLEKSINQSLLNLHKLATDSSGLPVPLPGDRLPGPAGQVHQGSGGPCQQPEQHGVPGRWPGRVRQNYRPECEAALNSLATLELHASFQCLAVAFYLDHDDVALKRFSRFFLLRSLEHSKTAQSLMFLQIQRGGRICFVDIRKPETQQWESALQAIQDTLHLEKSVNQSLLDLHQLATNSSDAHLCHFLGTGSLDQQVESMKELGNQLGNLSNVGVPECALAEYFFDKLSLGDGEKKD